MALANPGGRTRGVLKLCKLEPGEPDGILTTILEVRSQRRRRQSTRTAGDGTVVLGATSTMAGTPFGERVVTPKTREGTACYAGRHVSPHRTPQHRSLPASAPMHCDRRGLPPATASRIHLVWHISCGGFCPPSCLVPAAQDAALAQAGTEPFGQLELQVLLGRNTAHHSA